nr:expressed protein [Hymenolepis microstoma]
MTVMLALDDIRTLHYRKDFLKLSGISRFRRFLAIHWLTSLQRTNNLQNEVLHKAIDLLDSYLFLNMIVPMDYAIVALASIILAYEVKIGGDPEDFYAAIPEIGGFYTINQVRNYVNEMKTRSCRCICWSPIALDYYKLYEPALIEFNDEMKQWSGNSKFLEFFSDLARLALKNNSNIPRFDPHEIYEDVGGLQLNEIEVEEEEEVEVGPILQTFAEFIDDEMEDSDTVGYKLVFALVDVNFENEAGYGTPLPPEITLQTISQKWNSIPQNRKDGVLHSEPFHKTDADEMMSQVEAERREQVATAFNDLTENVEDVPEEDEEHAENEDLSEQDAIIEEKLASIQNKRDLMIRMDEIRSSDYCSEYWFRSGVSHYRRAHAVDWMSKLQRQLHWSDNVFYAAVDLLDSYLFVNVIVPSDYEMIGFACLILAHHIRDNANLEEIYQLFPEIGTFYTMNQVMFFYMVEH